MNPLEQLAQRVRNMLGRGIIRLVDDAAQQQLVQVQLYAGETRDRVERIQDYGFTAVPLDGAEAFYAALGGRRDHIVIFRADDRRHRMSGLQPGESAHHNHLGDYIKIRNGRIIEVVAGSEVTVTAPSVVVNGDTTINGNLQVNGTIDATDQIASATGVSTGTVQLGTHTHGGVSAGTDSSGGPQ